MKSTEVASFIISACSYIRLSQAKTLSDLVAAAMKVTRVSLAELGRTLAHQSGVATKHCIKRVDRFVGNYRIEPTEAMRGVVQWLARPRKHLLVSIDWVDIRHFHCLVLAARLHGRAIPLLWAVYRYEDFFRSQNNLEYGLLHLFRTMVPKSTEVVILADRGFGRAEMARECQKLNFDYVIRIEPRVYVKSRGFTGNLIDLPIKPGQQRLLRNVLYRKEKSVTQHVAVIWKTNKTKPWFLMTNLERIRARQLSVIFGKRMSIEEYFRDSKSKRNGFALRLTMIKSSERLSRFLLIVALAYILLVTIGLYVGKRLKPSQWCSNNRVGECSFFTIGRVMLHRTMPSLSYLLRNLRNEIILQNWG
jgi:hypothetical protein